MAERVYFIECGDAIKIGRSRDVSCRAQSLGTGASRELRVLGTVPGGAAVEASFHRAWHSIHIHGEWFKKCPDLLSYIRRCTSPWPPGRG